MAKLKTHQSEPDIGPAGSSQSQAAEPAVQTTTRRVLRRSHRAARRLWQASLGVAVSARDRASRAYNHLVEKGEQHQQQRREQQAAEARSLKDAAADRINNLEHTLEDRLDRGRDNTLHWIGVPSRKDFEALEAKLEALTEQLQRLQSQSEPRAARSHRASH